MRRAVVPIIVLVLGSALVLAILRFGALCQTPLRSVLPYCGGLSQLEPQVPLACSLRCHSEDDCPDPLYCTFNTFRLDEIGFCTGDVCRGPAICTCEGSDSVCTDGRRYTNMVECMLPAGLCACSGPSLTCASAGITNPTNFLCFPPANACGCSGTDEVCIIRGEVIVSRSNSPRCVAAPALSVCYQLCDPAAPACDPGLTCTRTEDGVNRCMGGVDSTGFDCTTWPSLTGCFTHCDPADTACDPGLTCVEGPGPFHWCRGGADTDGRSCPLPTPTPTPRVSGQGAGACNDACDPQASNCQAGLSCLPKSADSTEHICWNNEICAASVTTPAVTEASTEAVAECGPGWLPAGGCTCCGSTLTCADGTVAQFNPACMAGGDTGGTGDVCGDGMCSAAEAAVCGSCSADCGPC